MKFSALFYNLPLQISQLPLDFELSPSVYEFVDYGTVTTTVVNNPHKVGLNTSKKVALQNKHVVTPGDTRLVFSSITLNIPIDFSTKKKLKILVWSNYVNMPVKLTLQLNTTSDPTTDYSSNVIVTTTNGAWEDLTFDLTNINTSKTYKTIALIFNYASSSNFDVKYYFDNIRQES